MCAADPLQIVASKPRAFVPQPSPVQIGCAHARPCMAPSHRLFHDRNGTQALTDSSCRERGRGGGGVAEVGIVGSARARARPSERCLSTPRRPSSIDRGREVARLQLGAGLQADRACVAGGGGSFPSRRASTASNTWAVAPRDAWHRGGAGALGQGIERPCCCGRAACAVLDGIHRPGAGQCGGGELRSVSSACALRRGRGARVARKQVLCLAGACLDPRRVCLLP